MSTLESIICKTYMNITANNNNSNNTNYEYIDS